ncbi:hypothetical protein GCM10012275_49280 [Longimycelium tulufanense]|uniref:HTH tetR-type domain-containing protein n=1 Tax=Longimycelium tulufanense TaxID=907463 RepID=A0A8J3FXA3_9PSEU|nr:TetR family transcriptional regulator [Longimycelium tulufanense]GGM72776.1 hypothetical protein GCM10012275_49280 [Longimycelium tulufanense]
MRREQVLTAALRLVGERGVRALTHRAVDRAARVPAGTTSNHFRNRDALLAGMLAQLTEREATDLRKLLGRSRTLPPEDAVADLLAHWLGPARSRTTARYALFLEAARNPRLQRHVDEGRRLVRDLATQAAASAGATDAKRAAWVLTAFIDGVLLSAVTSSSSTPSVTELRYAAHAALIAAGVVWPPTNHQDDDAESHPTAAS